MYSSNYIYNKIIIKETSNLNVDHFAHCININYGCVIWNFIQN